LRINNHFKKEKMMAKHYSFLVLILFLLTACSGGSDKEPETSQQQLDTTPVETVYSEAIELLDSKDYTKATQRFDDVERLYPYSVWAKRANLMGAYSLYKSEEYDRAVITLDRFIQLYPADERIDYAYYLRGLVYYDQISDIRRDQSLTAFAVDNLKDVIRRFPSSRYAKDARLKLDLTYDHLAGHEMNIGRYYLERKIYNAAVKRFKHVVDNYQTTTHVAEALYRLVETYLALGLTAEAEKNAAILGHNYPGSDWYEDAYQLVTGQELKGQPGFFGRAWDSLVN
jgi:outer membrane protein assembly factor BamD